MKNIFITCLCILASSSIYAQEFIIDSSKTKKSQEIEIEDTVVTPTDSRYLFKVEKEMKDYGELGRTQIITREDIDNAPVQTLSGVLSRAKGIEIASKGPMGSMNEVVMGSGNSSNSVAVFIDGKRINSMLYSIYTLDNVPVSLEMIERIEIVEGGDSNRFGEFAVNGVINIITRKASSLAASGASVAAEGGLLNSYGASVTGGYDGRKAEVVFNATANSSKEDDIKSEHSNAKAYLASVYTPWKWVRVEAAASFVYNNYQAPMLLRQVKDVDNPEMMNTYNLRGDLDLIFPVGSRMDLYAKYSYANFKQQFDPENMRNTPLDSPYAEYYLDKVDYTHVSQQTLTFGGQYRNKMIDVFFGIDYNSAFMESSELYGELLSHWKPVPGEPHNYYQRYGSRDSWRAHFDMSLKFKRWYINSGISMGSSPEYEGMKFMYGGELGVIITNQLRIFGGYDRSFKDGVFHELYIWNDTEHGGDALDTEIVSAWFGGLKYRNKFSQLYVSAYTQSHFEPIVKQYHHNSIEDYYLYSNYYADRVGSYGISAKYSMNVDKLTNGKLPIKDLFISGAYNNENLKDTSEFMTNTYLKYKAELGMSIEPIKNVKIDLNFKGIKYYGEYVAIDPMGFTDTLSYDWSKILDARISYSPSNERFKVYVQGSNLLNEKYYEASRIRMPSACVLAGIKYNLIIQRKKRK
ncbi:MAG: TonB-dependent receptor plug domain-containing protein [Flavobacteriales bacterium]|nr:TonB-dependent receptor plug domain-containing protein [Flavobacteriales bacterium]